MKVLITSFVASFLSRAADLTATVPFVAVFVTLKSPALRSFASPATVTTICVTSDCLASLKITFLIVKSTSLLSLPAVAVILTVPALTALTAPVASTVAIVSSDDLKETVFFGVALAVIVVVSPTANSVAAALTVNVGFLTVIVAFKLVALPFLGVTLTKYPCVENR